MIETRLFQHRCAPRPPPWLDPANLGISKLRFVEARKVQVIDGGRAGLARFLRKIHQKKQLPLVPEAFVVVSRDLLRHYAFSREQFWLAASGIVKPEVRKRLGKQVFESCIDLLEAVPKFPTALFSEEVHVESVISELFDIHEYAEVAKEASKTTDSAKLRGPTVILDDAQQLTGVAVPDSKYGIFPIESMLHAGEILSEESGPQHASVLRTVTEAPSDTALALPAERVVDAEPLTTEQIVRRTPHIDFSPGAPFQLDQKFTVEVYANMNAPREGEESKDLEFVAPANINEFEITVWLSATKHFAIIEPQQTIVIRRQEPRSTVAKFELMVMDTDTGATATTPEIVAVFIYNQRTCGQVSRKVSLSGKTQQQKVDPTESGEFKIDFFAVPPDITVVITNPDNDSQNFKCRVSTPLLEDYKSGVTRDWPLKGSTDAIIADFFSGFTVKNLPNEERLAALVGAGLKLFALAPPIFQEALWRIIDLEKKSPRKDSAKKFKTIAIISQEALVPWELMVPERRLEDGTLEQHCPLGVEFAVGRWIYRDKCVVPQTVRLSDSWIFAPKYRGPNPKPLLEAPIEAAFVSSRFQGELISPAVFKGLSNAMKKGGRSLLHFICHGAKPTAGKQSVYYENNAPLSSVEIRAIPGVQQAVSTKKPFVFLNACNVGRTTPALIGVGGFASEFIQMGASCVIAPLWSVKDDIAHKVAQDFYEATAATPQKPFAEIVRSIRAKAYGENGGEDTYAAYCFYGDPLAAQSVETSQ